MTTNNVLDNDLAQSLMFDAITAANTGYDAIDTFIMEIQPYMEALASYPSRQRDHSFMYVLHQIMKMPTHERWLMLNHYAESHGLELYK